MRLVAAFIILWTASTTFGRVHGGSGGGAAPKKEHAADSRPYAHSEGPDGVRSSKSHARTDGTVDTYHASKHTNNGPATGHSHQGVGVLSHLSSGTEEAHTANNAIAYEGNSSKAKHGDKEGISSPEKTGDQSKSHIRDNTSHLEDGTANPADDQQSNIDLQTTASHEEPKVPTKSRHSKTKSGIKGNSHSHVRDGTSDGSTATSPKSKAVSDQHQQFDLPSSGKDSTKDSSSTATPDETRHSHERNAPGSYAPDICATSKSAAEAVCNKRPVCKYQVQNDGGGFHISTKLRSNQDDCIRRCDKRYGLSQAHCGPDETCFRSLQNCTYCAHLSMRGCEAF